MKARAYQKLESFVFDTHSQALVALGMLCALVDKNHASWFGLGAAAIFVALAYFAPEFEFGPRVMKVVSGVQALAFGCISMLLARLFAEKVLDLMRMPTQPRSAIWLASVVLVAGWAAWKLKQIWLFAFGATEIAWGVVIGLSSQSPMKTGPQGGLELITLVTSVYFIARGIGNCADANALAKSHDANNLIEPSTVGAYDRL